MSRLFDSASSESLYNNSAPVTGYPFTLSAWIYPANITTFEVILFIGDKDVDTDLWLLVAEGSTSPDPITFRSRAGGSNADASTTTGYSVNTWHHACAVATSATDRAAFIDGGSKGTNTTSNSPSGADRVAIGANERLTAGAYFNGRIAEAAIWSVALTDAEVVALSKGYSPLFIRPGSLVFYSPLIRDDDRDIIGGLSLTANGTPTIAEHPRTIYPVRSQIITAPAAAAAGALHPSSLGLLGVGI